MLEKVPMRTFVESADELQLLNDKCRRITAELFIELKPEVEFCRILQNRNVLDDRQLCDELLLVKEGYLTYRRKNRRIFAYEQGDVVGLDHLFAPAGAVELSSSYPVTVDVYSADKFEESLDKKPRIRGLWNELLVLRMNLVVALMSTLTETHLHHVQPQERWYDAGEVIIEQGAMGAEIYLLVSGHAEVLVDGTAVGEIVRDELFGVIAALTGFARTATVRATKPSRVLFIDRATFVELIRWRPSTIQKMTEGMARIIVELNKKIAKPELRMMENLRGG